MPRSKVDPPQVMSPAQVNGVVKDLIARPEVTGALMVTVVAGQVGYVWAADDEASALQLVGASSELQQSVAEWLLRGGMRPTTGKNPH